MLKTIFSALTIAAALGGSAIEAHAQYRVNLSGPWTCVGRCTVRGGQAWIDQRGGGMTLINEVRQTSRAYMADPFTIVAIDWRLTGRVSRRGDQIIWGSGDNRWVR